MIKGEEHTATKQRCIEIFGHRAGPGGKSWPGRWRAIAGLSWEKKKGLFEWGGRERMSEKGRLERKVARVRVYM